MSCTTFPLDVALCSYSGLNDFVQAILDRLASNLNLSPGALRFSVLDSCFGEVCTFEVFTNLSDLIILATPTLIKVVQFSLIVLVLSLFYNSFPNTTNND